VPGELLAEVVGQLGCHGNLRRCGRGALGGGGHLPAGAERTVNVTGQREAERLDAASTALLT
jgi:hypothetical protein